MSEISYRDAIREALQEEMKRDESVFIMGEDVADYGGAFRVTDGMLAEFGAGRIFDTPLSESAIMGAAVGAALMGMRPVVELMFADFVGIAMDAIVNHAAKTNYLYGGKLSAPVVVRIAYGAGLGKGAQHSQSVESWLANVPGLTIVMPSTPYDAKGLLKSAIRIPNPVIYLEHILLYNTKGEVPDTEYFVTIGEADIKREGDDLTLVASGAMVTRSLAAAQILEQKGISAEVIDLRSIQPMDEKTILDSVRKTGRLVIVHEAPVRGGYGGEIAAVVAEKALGFLDAPIHRVGAPWTPVPFNPVLEAAYIPTESEIVDAASVVMDVPVI
jgi:pyruvate/2-oxoglutarate/acetoin dehydrogenase E1 component